MAVTVDTAQLKELQEKLSKLGASGDVFANETLDNVAMRFLRKVRNRTPVGVYPGKKEGGTLRKGWDKENIERSSIGQEHIVTITNPVEYAEYVEYGHLAGTKNPRWVKGRFMASISQAEIERILPALVAKRLEEFMQEMMK